MTTTGTKMGDLVSVMTALAASQGITMSADLSAYSIMLLASVGGAIWAAIGQDDVPSSPTVWRIVGRLLRQLRFVIGRVGLVMIVGALIVNVLSSKAGVDARDIVAPVGGFVAAVGPGWFMRVAKTWVHMVLSRGKSTEGNR